jgi:acyl-CoA synthetase (AMP-forming)/AMP-acid ligase II
MFITKPLHDALQQDPKRTITVFADRSTTVEESVDRIARLAGALRGLGVETGDRVGILALNSDRYHEILLATPWAGAVVNPVNIRWSPTEVAYSLVDCATDVLFVDDAFVAMVDVLRTEAPNLKTVVFCGEGPTPDGVLGYERLLLEHEPVEDARRGGDDLFGVFYTGGTTGHPKGVMLSHDNVIVSAMGTVVTTEFLTRGGNLLHAAPMFHLADIAAWCIGLLTGSTHIMVPAFTPDGVITAIARHEVTDTLLVPTMIQMMLDSPLAESSDLSSLQRVGYGGSPMPQAILERARDLFVGARFAQSYGMTELSPIVTVLSADDHDDPTLAGSCGRAASHAEIRIVDENGAEVPHGTAGEIIVSGAHVMQGYWNLPELTEQTLRDGWMHTGDCGFMNERGYLFIVDRLKDMIVTGGENVYSAEVENVLIRHDAVATCAVIALPDAQWGERVHAVVVTHAGASVTGDELRDFCRPHIANYKVPRSVSFVDEMPISAAGKILKRELRLRDWDEAGRQVPRESSAR